VGGTVGVNVGRNVFVAAGVGVFTLTTRLPTEHPKVKMVISIGTSRRSTLRFILPFMLPFMSTPLDQLRNES
jgi:hypothetical protein